jgi:hypothetical protein
LGKQVFFEAGEQNPYCHTDTGKKLTGQVLALLNEEETLATVRRIYPAIYAKREILSGIHGLLGLFLDKQSFDAIYANSDRVTYERDIMPKNKLTNPYDLSAAILYASTDPISRAAVFADDKAADWMKFEGIGKRLVDLMKNAEDCLLKEQFMNDIEKIAKQRGKTHGA